MSELPVKLGRRNTLAVPQTHVYLRKKLGGMIGVEQLADPTRAVAEMDRNELYYVLSILYPKWAKECPEHEFEGYNNEQDYRLAKQADRERKEYQAAVAEYERLYDVWSTEGGDPPEQPTPPDPFLDTYDENNDPSPTPPQMIDAIKASITVHGGEVIELLRAYVGPKLVEQGFELLAAQAADKRIQRTASIASQSSPSPSGASDLTSSGTTAPTSSENEV